MRLCAGQIGQLLNKNSFANALGVSVNTIESWLTLLEASYIIFRLQPFHSNFKKRLVKTPKLYFTDVGLASYLLGIENTKQLVRDPARGHLFENLVILEAVKNRLNKNLDPHCYFYRDSTGNEVDLILQRGQTLYPIEIKSSQTFHTSMLRGLKHFTKQCSSRVDKQFLIYNGEHQQTIDDISLLNYQNFPEEI